MRKMLAFVAIVTGALIGLAVAKAGGPQSPGVFLSRAEAAPSCTEWMKQDNGCEWRTCVGDDGKQYCEEKCGDTISRVKCE